MKKAAAQLRAMQAYESGLGFISESAPGSHEAREHKETLDFDFGLGRGGAGQHNELRRCRGMEHTGRRRHEGQGQGLRRLWSRHALAR